jgi:GNAT superfamily N-acetyltransferase
MRSFYPVGNAFERALASLRYEGARTFAWKLASALGYRRVVRLERMLDEPIPDATPTLPVRFEFLGADQVGDYVAARPEANRDEIASRLASGCPCFVLRHEDRIVSVCWATTASCRSAYLGRDVILAVGDVYCTDAWTEPALRGRALAHALSLEQLRHFRDRGFRRAIRGTVPENPSALRVHAKSGYRPTALHVSLRIGRWQRDFDRPWTGR